MTGRPGGRPSQLLGDLKETRDWKDISDGKTRKKTIRLLDDFKKTRDWKDISDGKTRKKTCSATG